MNKIMKKWLQTDTGSQAGAITLYKTLWKNPIFQCFKTHVTP